MKKTILIFISILLVSTAHGQISDRLTYITTLGTGIPINEPSSTPFTWQIAGHYKVTERFSAGIGTGLSFYEKALIPVFTDIRYQLTVPGKWIPYLQCSIGYSFAPDKHTNGGYFFNPSAGMQYALHGKVRLLLGIGYEIQNLERLKKYENNNYTAEFHEKLHHNSISVKLGILF